MNTTVTWLKLQWILKKIEKKWHKSCSKLLMFLTFMSLFKPFYLYMLLVELPVSLLIQVMVLPTLYLFMMVILFLMLLWELISPEEILLTGWLNYVEKLVNNLLHLPKEKSLEILKKNFVMLPKIIKLKWKNTNHPHKKTKSLNYLTETNSKSEIKDLDVLKLFSNLC